MIDFWLYKVPISVHRAKAFKESTLRAAFKFGQRVHFALRRKMLNPPIARLPAILLYYINLPSEETDCIYEATIK